MGSVGLPKIELQQRTMMQTARERTDSGEILETGWTMITRLRSGLMSLPRTR